MSNKKKSKKLRTPNVPQGPVRSSAPDASAAVAPARGAAAELRSARPAAPSSFDYTYVRQDLTRIGALAGSFIVILVVLSFFIH